MSGSWDIAWADGSILPAENLGLNRDIKHPLNLLGRDSLLEEVDRPSFMDGLLILNPNLPEEEVEFLDDLGVALERHVAENIWHHLLDGQQPIPCSLHIIHRDEEFAAAGDGGD